MSSPAAAAKRPNALRHIDALFGEPRRSVTDWDLIERHFDDLMRVVLSVAAGKISSLRLLCRLSKHSRRNNFYMGRVRDNNPAGLENPVKSSTLPTSAVIFRTTRHRGSPFTAGLMVWSRTV